MWAVLVGTYNISLDDASRFTPRRFNILTADRAYEARTVAKKMQEINGPTPEQQRRQAIAFKKMMEQKQGND